MWDCGFSDLLRLVWFGFWSWIGPATQCVDIYGVAGCFSQLRGNIVSVFICWELSCVERLMCHLAKVSLIDRLAEDNTVSENVCVAGDLTFCIN